MNNENKKNSFPESVKQAIRSFLIVTARKLSAEKPKGPAVRNIKKSLLRKEMKVPRWLSASVASIIITVILSLHFAPEYKTVAALIILIAGIIAFFIIQGRDKENDVLIDNDAVVLMSLLVVIAVFILLILFEYLNPISFPVSAFSVMAAMLLSGRIGLMYALVLSILTGLVADMNFDVFCIMFCGSIAAMTGIKKIRKRSDFTRVFAKTALVNIAVISMFFLFGTYDFYSYEVNIFYGILNAVFAIVLILVFMPFFEMFFSRTTNIKLIELTDFNNRLLKRLMLEAPGTYHHSLMTAAIAEQAADAIGADSLLARVSAYYHDIGKLNAPEYFIENQGATPNPHDPLTPAMSSLILVSHVKDGVALAKKHNLDKSIIDNIEQHHGTTTIHFFYHKALELSKEVAIEDFRYPGPKPQTKVAAILMIADSSEAACRALDDPTAVRIKETVEKLINNKFTDGQFSECPITLKDLQIIGESVISSLIGIHHARIEYKDDEKK